MARIAKGTIASAQADERRAIKARARTDKKPTGDAYQNFVQSVGLGTDNSMSGSTYGFNPITRIRTLLEWIYRGNWLGGVAVDIVADDMTREGIEIVSDNPPEEIATIYQALTRTGIWGGINDVIKWSRLYGGAIGVLLIDGQDVSTPLNIDRVGKGAFRGILSLDRWMVEPDLSDLVTDLGPELGMPKFYRVLSAAPALRMKKVHYSRTIRMVGTKLPYWQAVMENLWGLSIFERLYDRMVCFDSATLGMAQLVSKAYIRTYKFKGLRKLLAEGQGSRLYAWAEMTRRFQGNEGITLIDGEDEFVTSQVSAFVGISDVILQLGQQISGGLQIPLTRLFGQSPAGLNSTGENDQRTYDDGIKQKQEMEMREGVNKIVRVIAQSEAIKLPENFHFNFNSIRQLSEDQKSQIFARDSTAVVELLSEGVVPMMTALKELRQLSRVTGRMSNITDEDIANADSEPPPQPIVAEPPSLSEAHEIKKPNIGPDRAEEDKPIKSAEDYNWIVSKAQSKLIDAANAAVGKKGRRWPTVADANAKVRAAGILFMAPSGKALWLRRTDEGDHSGKWCLPGGKLENGETEEQAAVRECGEEIGYFPEGKRIPLYRSISESVDFTTFLQGVEGLFQVSLNNEHDAYAWAPIENPPYPLHPGVAEMLAEIAKVEVLDKVA